MKKKVDVYMYVCNFALFFFFPQKHNRIERRKEPSEIGKWEEVTISFMQVQSGRNF